MQEGTKFNELMYLVAVQGKKGEKIVCVNVCDEQLKLLVSKHAFTTCYIITLPV